MTTPQAHIEQPESEDFFDHLEKVTYDLESERISHGLTRGILLCASAPTAPAVPQGWKLVIPGRLRTDQWDSARVGDYNNGWNDCLRKVTAALESLATPAAPSQPVTLTDAWLLEQFKHHPNWELSTSNDPECDPSAFWLVHDVKGGRNDREWFLIGEGESPRAAIIAALREKEGKW